MITQSFYRILMVIVGVLAVAYWPAGSDGANKDPCGARDDGGRKGGSPIACRASERCMPSGDLAEECIRTELRSVSCDSKSGELSGQLVIRNECPHGIAVLAEPVELRTWPEEPLGDIGFLWEGTLAPYTLVYLYPDGGKRPRFLGDGQRAVHAFPTFFCVEKGSERVVSLGGKAKRVQLACSEWPSIRIFLVMQVARAECTEAVARIDLKQDVDAWNRRAGGDAEVRGLGEAVVTPSALVRRK